MIRPLRLLLVCAVAITQVASADSWVGDRFGWELRAAGLSATEDGGRTWRVIFDNCGGGAWLGYVQTSPRTGVVRCDPRSYDDFWTTDNGRHWFFTDAIGQGNDVEGHGSFLFWSDFTGRLYKVRRWPPTAAAHRCRTTPQRQPYGEICFRPARDLTNVLIRRFPDGDIERLANAPAGIVALVSRPSEASTATPFVRVFIWRQFTPSRLAVLPESESAAQGLVRGLDLVVSWPVINVLGIGTGGRVVATWQSSNGGRTWRLFE